MDIVETSIRRPVAITVIVLLILIFGSLGLLGVYDFLRLPIQLTPDVDQPVITVTTNWFGASPQEIEQEIIEEQEEVLKTVGGLREMVSKSQEGEGSIELQFFVGIDREAALNEVRDKLRQVPQYPQDVDEPVVAAVNPSADSPIAWLTLRPTSADSTSTTRAAATHIPGYDGDVTQLQDFMDDEVKPILERVPGVEQVSVLGGRQREMQVRVDLERLAARGISIAAFDEALRRENSNVTAGTVTEGKRDTSIRAVGQYSDPQEIRDTVVAYTDAGAPVYVRDVAEVSLGFRKPVGFVRSSGSDVIAVNAKRETGSNVLEVMAGLKKAIEKVNREVLAARGLGLELHQVYDESEYVQRSIDNARHDLVIGAILAGAVLFLALRSVGATLVIATSIPISVIGTFLGMALAGRNLNVISMAGLTFSVGIGIDNAIVVLENIFRHREMGKDRVRAAIDGAREVWGAIVASILTNVAVFVPILFIQEEAGQLFRDIAVAITISMALYLAVSPTFIPMLAAIFLRKMPGGFAVEAAESESQTFLGRLTRPLSHGGAALSHLFYRMVYWLTGGVFRRLALVIVMTGTATYLSWALVPPQTYLPAGNQNFVFAILSPPPGYNIDEFRGMARQVESHLSPWWNVMQGSPELAALQANWRKTIAQFVLPGMEQQVAQMRGGISALEAQITEIKSKTPPDAQAGALRPLERQLAQAQSGYEQMSQRVAALKAANPPAIENFFFVAFRGIAFMGASTQDPDNVSDLTTLMNGSLQGIPGTFGFAQQVPIFRLGRTSGNSVELNVTGLDYDKVRMAAGIIQGSAIQRFGVYVQADPTNFSLGRPELRIVPDRVRAAAAGISTGVIREMTQVAVDGQIIGDYRLGGKAIDLVVMSAKKPVISDDLRDVPMVGADGRPLPMSSVATLLNLSAAQQINRVERQPAVTLGVPLPPGMTIQEAQTIIEQEIVAPLRQNGVIPPEVSIQLTGSADKLREFMRAFVPGFILAAVVTYLLLAALFESWIYPFVIIMTVPFALVGGFIGMAILHHFVPSALLDVLTMLGFVILVGIIVNNPILIVHQALNYLRAGETDRRRAIALSTQTRVRPIFMSVITSVAGMTPLVVFGGAGSELYRGLGAVVIGGLLLSTIFTLFLTPSLMSLMLDAQDRLRRMFSGS